MNVTAVDSTNRLFLVEDILPKDMISQLHNVDWLSLEWKRPTAQEKWLRRELAITPELSTLNDSIAVCLPVLEQECNVQFSSMYTTWWLDEPGFKVDIHTDGHLPSAMQLFWIAESEDFGTAFYNSKNRTDLRHQFMFCPNSGYLMLNGLDQHGAQPLQWHGMLKRTSTVRITSYTTFGSYSAKK